MQTSTVVLVAALAMAALFTAVRAAPMGGEPVYNYARPGEIDAEDLVELLKRIAQELRRPEQGLQEAKRGMDFGLSRGFSGAGAAKHLMGLAAANYAGGPGRRRRSAAPAAPAAPGAAPGAAPQL
ncbi:Calcitonin-like Diuretic hormone [Frankliniella occidentalis]|uniref:Diuretic hormone class 2 n=1 Tax=Frankliniella occidentalis TaxID=133901 RepID=A0A6J1S244_FRAOC|nr:diuretic hormone class 2 [Frankliniella occidentalis]XP_052125486.1 diuretic hormone class 2 [Frankliniella occidentalis]KAE8744738.1 Calcitonin-like Diuretic hormone [Frankliniella occidentalis]